MVDAGLAGACAPARTAIVNDRILTSVWQRRAARREFVRMLCHLSMNAGGDFETDADESAVARLTQRRVGATEEHTRLERSGARRGKLGCEGGPGANEL